MRSRPRLAVAALATCALAICALTTCARAWPGLSGAGLAAGAARERGFYSGGRWIALAAVPGLAPAPAGRAPAASGRLLVRLKPPTALQSFLARVAGSGVSLERVVSARPLRVALRLRPDAPADALEVAASIYESGLADYAVPELWFPMELRNRDVPDDPLFPREWHLANTGQGGRVVGADVGALEAWRYTRGSAAIVIAVLDDGVETSHPDLAANVSPLGRDFTTQPPGADPAPGPSAAAHGTAVAGVAAARGDNGIGVTGICPRCTILPIRIYEASNLATAAAFRYAVRAGADIITNSWGYTRPMPLAADDAVRDAIEEAARTGRGGRGALVVFGMTNESVDDCRAPTLDISSLDSVVAVGVSDHNDGIGGSGYGDCMDLVAPSKPEYRSTIGIATTDRTGLDGHADGDYDLRFGGTSAAAPLVAGVAGLLLSLNPELTRDDVLRILEQTASKIDAAAAAYDAAGFSSKAGYGRVDAARALVPTVRISVSPARVAVGRPFSVTVSATAPFGLASLSWFGMGTGLSDLDAPHTRRGGGRAVETATWRGVVIRRPGRFALGADARDTGRGAAGPDYPHRASEAAAVATARITIVPP